jgi:hypothetical protein
VHVLHFEGPLLPHLHYEIPTFWRQYPTTRYLLMCWIFTCHVLQLHLFMVPGVGLMDPKVVSVLPHFWTEFNPVLLHCRFHLPSISFYNEIYRIKLFINKKTKLRGFSPQSELYRPSDRRLSAKLVLTLADRGCQVISATNPHSR